MDNRAMFTIGYGLYVLSTRYEGSDNACIINTAMQITSTPNQILLGVNKLNKTHNMLASGKSFNLSPLTIEAPFDIFKRFGMQSGKTVDKFDGFTHAMRAGNGVYYMSDYANSCISGWVTDTRDMGTHTLFIATVADAFVLSSVDSVTYSYYQKNIKPAPKPVAKGWRCRICGYVYEGEVLPEDFICPICKHGASDFERIV